MNPFARDILDQISKINPYTGAKSVAYTVGFLTGYLSTLMQKDPFIYRQFVKHCEHTKKTRIL